MFRVTNRDISFAIALFGMYDFPFERGKLLLFEMIQFRPRTDCQTKRELFSALLESITGSQLISSSDISHVFPPSTKKWSLVSDKRP